MNRATNQTANEPDHYATNLAVINKVNTVTTTENIYNNLGVLIVAKGTEISAHAYQIIIKHKLQKPIENSIQLDNTLTPDKIYLQFTTLTLSSELKSILCNKMNIDKFMVHCQQLQEYPLLLQKLTVLQARFPTHYRKTIYGALFSLCLCYEQKLSYDISNNTFLAALFRDLGLLHIDAMVVDEKGKLSAQSWKLLQGHVPIGYNVAKLIPGLAKEVARAVLEHHETTDGFGYPLSKIENKLSLEGQIVAFADTFVALFQKHIFQYGRSISDLIPILQINSGVNLHQNTQAALRLISAYSTPTNTMKIDAKTIQLGKSLLQRQPKISRWFENALQFHKLLATKHPNCNLQSTTKFFERQQEMLSRSGICDALFLDWLRSLDLSHLNIQDALEIQKSELMLNEISWQFEQLLKIFKAIAIEVKASSEELITLRTKIDLLQNSLR
ncbi:HD-GYP domain-containing protein [Psychromonas antarctica]|jgi:response regulator RpfG family c-di-GMP phosphodiesterase|uniref:HD-GYP domain-containing protein n=1 Tax=Psychromonas antarctica TaxID=67573 RepID=UPI001EE88F2C|nr:HD domain-containing phosphohydrolase [Psychromonas antarctica]MCG6200921.1 hypothetical protein [Psychromonas antarctica]